MNVPVPLPVKSNTGTDILFHRALSCVDILVV